MNSQKNILKIVVPIILVLIFLNTGVVLGVYYYNQYQTTDTIRKNLNTPVDKETVDLLSKVGKLMLLPKDEVPTIATVTDVSKLQTQAFFKHATNGDKVLIYVKEKKAILYSPTLNLIVDVAPVNENQSKGKQTVTPVPTISKTQATTPVVLRAAPTLTPISTK